ncbi:MAG: hypothetical protein Q4Q22_03255 [Methanosphaera sp.]|nr:hypothetical protein [Methanosphaera sp.]
MKITDIIINSLWVLLSLINFINGAGFIYMGFKTKNNMWLLEGIVYEMPWILIIICGLLMPNVIVMLYLGTFAFVLQIISIIRSIWVDYKYIKFIHSNQKYLNE